MTEREIKTAKDKLHVKNHGELRNLFYNKIGLQKNVLLSNAKILKALGIMDSKPNSLELEGLLRNLGVSLAYLRKQAKSHNLAWVDYEIQQPNKKPIARHGFSIDLIEIDDNATKFEKLAKGSGIIARETRKIAKVQERLLTA